MDITEDALQAASQRGKDRQAASPAVVAVRYDRAADRVVFVLASGIEIAFPPALAEGLQHAGPGDLEQAEISPSGLGVHFPRLDADLYVPALLEGLLGSRRWMAAEIGRRGGSASSEAKAAAARRNGKLGGRPRKPPAPASA